MDKPEAPCWQGVVSQDGIFAVDCGQCINYWSPSAQRLLGYQPSEALGKSCYELIGGRDSRNYRFCRRDCPIIVNARKGRATPDFDILCTLPSGQQRWLNVTVVLHKPARGNLQVVHIFRDVTHRRRVEEFAKKAGLALRNLLGEDPLATQANGHRTPGPTLSRREQEILRLLATGLRTRQIAATLGIRPVTARNHVTRILSKLGVENRLQAVVYASERGLI